MNLKEILKYIKLKESTISFIVGIVVIVLSIGILISYFRSQPNVSEEFSELQIGEITPDLTSAYPGDTVNLNSPTETSNLNNPANTSSASTEVKMYTVKKGDSLWKIAIENYSSGYNWNDIAKANELTNANVLEVGQILYIPNIATNSTPDEVITSAPSAINNNIYTVEKGDCLWNIAVRAYGDGFRWSEIARENNITTPNLIYPGNLIRLPRNS